MNPKRIQRKRTKGWRMPEGAVYVGRPSLYANPFRLGATVYVYRGKGGWQCAEVSDRSDAVSLFRDWVADEDALDTFGREHHHLSAVLDDLRGKDLACWCPLDQPCHADVLLEIANRS